MRIFLLSVIIIECLLKKWFGTDPITLFHAIIQLSGCRSIDLANGKSDLFTLKFFWFFPPAFIAKFGSFFPHSSSYLFLLLPFLFILALLQGIVRVCGLFGAMICFSSPNVRNAKVLLSARWENSNGPKWLSGPINQRAVDTDHFHLYNTAYRWWKLQLNTLFVCSPIMKWKEWKIRQWKTLVS